MGRDDVLTTVTSLSLTPWLIVWTGATTSTVLAGRGRGSSCAPLDKLPVHAGLVYVATGVYSPSCGRSSNSPKAHTSIRFAPPHVLVLSPVQGVLQSAESARSCPAGGS